MVGIFFTAAGLGFDACFFTGAFPTGINQIIIDKIKHIAKNTLETNSDFCSSVKGCLGFCGIASSM